MLYDTTNATDDEHDRLHGLLDDVEGAIDEIETHPKRRDMQTHFDALRESFERQDQYGHTNVSTHSEGSGDHLDALRRGFAGTLSGSYCVEVKTLLCRIDERARVDGEGVYAENEKSLSAVLAERDE